MSLEKPSDHNALPSSATSFTMVDDAHTSKAESVDTAENIGDLEKGTAVLERKESVIQAHDPRAFPDGGLEAWLAVFGGFCCLFCSFGWINAIGIFQGYYETHQLKNYSPSTVSWIASLETFFMFVGGAIVGKLTDSYGPRYILLAGTFLHVFGLMMASISTQYAHFVLSQGICSSIGASMIFYPAVSSVSTWFHKRRATALGIVASGSSLGGIIFPIMLSRLIPKVGFAWSMRITAFMILGMMVFGNLTVKSRLQPRGPTPWSLTAYLNHFKQRSFALSVAASFVFFFGMFIPFNFLPLYAMKQGMSLDLANYLISILNAASVFGRIIPGIIGDKVGRFNTTVVITYLSGILIFAAWFPATSNAPIIVFAAFYGFSTGAFVSLIPALIAQISDIRVLGERNGALFAVVSIGALTGNPISGALIDAYDGGYRGAQIFAGVTLVTASTIFLLTRLHLAGVKLEKV